MILVKLNEKCVVNLNLIGTIEPDRSIDNAAEICVSGVSRAIRVQFTKTQSIAGLRRDLMDSRRETLDLEENLGYQTI